MLGAIIGDIVGSVYEGSRVKTVEFPLFCEGSRFTDDTVLTVATADTILGGKSFGDTYQEYYHRYPLAGFGGSFIAWAAQRRSEPYNSWGNGSAMRVSPVGIAFRSLPEVLDKARESAEVTHNHPEGIKGAQAIAAAVFLARTGWSKDDIRNYITAEFGYDLSESIESIRKWYVFDVSCQGSVPQAIRAFLESWDLESAIRLAVSIGGDTDTIASMAGALAEAFYREIPPPLERQALKKLDDQLTSVLLCFRKKYIMKR